MFRKLELGRRVLQLFWGVRGLTLAAITLAWVPFRSGTLEQSVMMMTSMLWKPALQVSYSVNQYLMTALVAVFCLIEPWLVDHVPQGDRPAVLHLWLRPLAYASLLLLFLIFDDRDVQFIYFQF